MDKKIFMEIWRFHYPSGAKYLKRDTLKTTRSCLTLPLGLISPRRESESEVLAQLPSAVGCCSECPFLLHPIHDTERISAVE